MSNKMEKEKGNLCNVKKIELGTYMKRAYSIAVIMVTFSLVADSIYKHNSGEEMSLEYSNDGMVFDICAAYPYSSETGTANLFYISSINMAFTPLISVLGIEQVEEKLIPLLFGYLPSFLNLSTICNNIYAYKPVPTSDYTNL